MQDEFKRDITHNIELLRKDYESVGNKMNGAIALFGAGQFGASALRYLRKNGYNVVCFIDNSPQKQGTVIEGLPVVPYGNERSMQADCILITARHVVPKIREQLGGSLPSMSFDSWFATINMDKYNHLKDSVLSDKRSRQCIDGILLAMLTGNERYCEGVMDFNQYFCLPRFVNNGNEYFIDAGAYVGDTIEKFLWANNGAFRHIYAFEPGRRQFAALIRRKERLLNEWALDTDSISIINAGLSDNDGEASEYLGEGMHPLSTSLKMGSNTASEFRIKVYSLDRYISDVPITFIKSDIEGMEIAMLKGAIETIRRNKPKMALSTYHEPDDLFAVIEFVSDLAKDYKMAIRHHSPLLMDTTLYCWVEE